MSGRGHGEVEIVKVEEFETFIDRPLWGRTGPKKVKKYRIYPACGHPPIERRKSYLPKGGTIVCPYCEYDEEPQADTDAVTARC